MSNINTTKTFFFSFKLVSNIFYLPGFLNVWQMKAKNSLTDIHDGSGRHVTHGRWEEEKRVEALALVHLGLWPSSVMAK